MEDLYREVVIDRYRSPRHRGPLTDSTGQAHTQNPLCGDDLTIFVRVDGDTLSDASFEAQGCSISQASADLMIDAVRGQPLTGVQAAISAFRAMLAADEAQPSSLLGQAEVLAAVRKYPIRVKCAQLAWDTLETALAAGDAVHG
jgi:nitrogen fixation protein NifU and related proteins